MPDTVDFYEHIEYSRNKREWQLMDDLMQGVHACLTAKNYLWPHYFEQEERQSDKRDKDIAVEDRRLRERRTQYVNYIKMVRERLVSLIMKGGINLSSIEELYEGAENDVDGQGHSLERYFSILTEDCVSFGVVYSFTNAKTQDVRSLAEERESGARPFYQRLHPLVVKDWQNAPDGSYEMFRFEYQAMQPRKSLTEMPIVWRFTDVVSFEPAPIPPELEQKFQSGSILDSELPPPVYTIRTYISTDEDGNYVNYHPECASDKAKSHDGWEFASEVSTPLIETMPLATSGLQEAWLRDVSPLALKIFNKQSDLDNIIYNQGYDKTFVFSDIDTAVDHTGKEIDEKTKTIKISHNSVTLLPQDSKVDKLLPTFPEALFKAVEDDIADLFRIAFNMPRVINTGSRVGESAESRREMKEDLTTRLEEKRREMLVIFQQAISDWAMFKGVELAPEDVEIDFLAPLDERDIQELAMFVRQIGDRLRRYPAWEKSIDRKIAQRMNLPEEVDILKEIDSTDIEERREELSEQATNTLQEFAGNSQRPQPQTGNAAAGRGANQGDRSGGARGGRRRSQNQTRRDPR